MAETILVTGATGTVGSEIVKQLLSSAKGERGGKEEGVVIKAAARSANDSTFEKFGGVQVVQLDYNKPDTLTSALRGVDKLFLLTPFQSNMSDRYPALVISKYSIVELIVQSSAPISFISLRASSSDIFT